MDNTLNILGTYESADPVAAYNAANRKSMEPIRRMCGHRFAIPNYSGTFEILDMYKNQRKLLKRIPLGKFHRDHLVHMEQQKWMVQLYPYLTFFTCRKTRRPIAHVPEIVMISIDVDHDFDEVVAGIAKWKFAARFPVFAARSTSGKHAHLYFLLDVSSQTYGYNMKLDPNYFKTTGRYTAIHRFKAAVAKSFTEVTGMSVDAAALASDKLGITHLEVAGINKFFKDKAPIKFDGLLQEKVEEIAATIVAERIDVSHVKPMADELSRMLADSDLARKVFDYNEGIGNGRQRASEEKALEYFRYAINTLKRHQEEVVRHWAINPKIFHYLKSKQDDIGIHQTKAAEQVFGFHSLKLHSYFRKLIVYMFSLTKQANYIKKVKTDVFRVTESARDYFANSFLKEHWYNKTSRSNVAIPNVEELADSMGSGNTYATLCKQFPRMLFVLGLSESVEVMTAAINSSSARQKSERIRFVKRMANYLASQWNRDLPESSYVHVKGSARPSGRSQRVEPSRVPDSRLLNSQLAFFEGGDDLAVPAPIQYPVRSSYRPCRQ